MCISPNNSRVLPEAGGLDMIRRKDTGEGVISQKWVLAKNSSILREQGDC